MSYELLEWDSDFFGMPIGRVSGLEGEALSTAVEKADQARIRCLYLLCPVADLSRLHAALSLGFRPYDVRVKLTRELTGLGSRPEGVREAGAGDAQALVGLAGERMRDTRFWADEHFPRERVKALYEVWLRRGFSTAPMWCTLVVGEAEGFVTCGFDRERRVGTIELIAVADGREGTGLGDALVRAADCSFLEAGLERAEVVTQAQNVAAQRLYQRNGYRTSSIDVWLHRWVDA